MNQKVAKRILIVDDDKFSRSFYSDILLEENYTVDTATSAQEALRMLVSDGYDLVITDIVMPEIDGLELLNIIQQNFPQVDVIVTTGYAAVDTAVRALKSGAKDYLRKPVNAEEFKLTVQRALEQRMLFAENQEFRRFLGLFESCHRIAGCLDLDRLLPLSLHALGQELEAIDGLAVTRDTETHLTTETPLAIDSKIDWPRLIETATRQLDIKNLFQCKELKILREFPAFPGIEQVLVLPILVGLEVRAVFLMVYESGTISSSVSAGSLANRATFLGRQIALSTENAEKFSSARDQIFLDHLTGMYNAKYLAKALDREMKRSQRFKHSLSVLFIDLDHFKDVNDQYGHLVGTNVLIEISRLVQSCLREIDTAVRYGGDEFTILLVSTDSGGATKVAERIRQVVEAHAFLNAEGKSFKVTACIGIASYPEHAQSVQELLDMADQAMYRGKRSTRNVVYVFNPSVS